MRAPATEDSVRLEALATLFDEHYLKLVRMAYVLLSNQAEAEELTQDAFAELHHRWNEVLNPAGYLRTTVVNGARRTLRRRIQRDEIHQKIGPSVTIETAPDDYLIDALSRIPDRQRTALVLAYYLDLSIIDIATTIGCRPGTAKSLVHRGLASLRKELKP